MTTIIRIKYTDTAVTDEANNTSGTSSESSVADNKELLVNINCNTGLIVDYIREVTQLKPTERHRKKFHQGLSIQIINIRNHQLIAEAEFDLWEESTSILKNISYRNPRASGLEVFLPNHTYFLIAVKRDAKGQIVNYVPMISGRQSRALSETVAKMRRLSKKNSITTVSSSRLHDKGGRKNPRGNPNNQIN